MAFLYEFKGIKGKHFIVCPNSVVNNWVKEFKKWLPQLKVTKLIARKEYRGEILRKEILPRKFDVVVTSYEGVNICKKYLTKIKWKYLIVDEAHKIKNE